MASNALFGLLCDQEPVLGIFRALRVNIPCPLTAPILIGLVVSINVDTELSADLANAVVAYCQLIVVSKFIEKLRQNIPGDGVKEQLQALCSIYTLSIIKKHLGDFLTTTCITPKQAYLANDLLRSLFTQVRPNTIALVDALNYTDHFLGSTLGQYDGNVYPKLCEEAWKDALNKSVVLDGDQEYGRPMLKLQLRNSRL